jgi:hypothetical protein
MKLAKDKSTPENREYWDFVEKTAAEVATWPAWKTGRKETTVELNDAIERVERLERHADWLMRSYQSNTDPGERVFCSDEAKRFKADAEALHLVLEAAKRTYALSDLDRMFLRRLEFAGEELTRDHDHKDDAWCPDCEETQAITAALNLTGPGFTREELESLHMLVKERLSICSDERGLGAGLLAKLIAYLEKD